ncbi:hypothetical protein HYX01_02590 [Candidatus Woesearchaeota archaeon]|nr:hypothetical protein [Candidatus Woesearchaeota archaeon]
MQIDYLTYFLASIASYSGLLLGIILIKLAPEEQNPGKRYFILLQKIILLAALIFLLAFYKVELIISAIIILAAILLLNKKIIPEKTGFAYIFLGTIFYLSSKIFDLFVIEASLIFLFGVPTSSLIFNYKKKNYNDVFTKNLWFFVSAILIYFMF